MLFRSYPRVPITPRPQRALPFPLSIRGNALWKNRASEPHPIHASSFGRLFPYNNIESLLSPEEQPPPQEPECFLYRYKKTARSISTGSGRFFFLLYGNERQPKPCPPLPTFPSALRQAQQTEELLPCSLPTSRKPQERKRAGGGNSFFKRGFLP